MKHHAEEDGKDTTSKTSDDLVHYKCPTLAHFLALIGQDAVKCVPEGTSLVIIDSLSALLNYAFPRHTHATNTPISGGKKGRWVSGHAVPGHG